MASNRVLKGLCLLSDSELAWHWAGLQALMAAPASSPVAGRRPGSLSARTSESGPRESKWTGRPMPATSWPGRVARRAPRRTSDTSLQVTYIPNSVSSTLIPCTNGIFHQRCWRSGIESRAVCRRSRVRILWLYNFLHFVDSDLYCVIPEYTSISCNIHCISLYIHVPAEIWTNTFQYWDIPWCTCFSLV